MKITRYLVATALGAGLALVFRPRPAPVYERVEVPVESIREIERVDTIIRFRERIVYRTVPAVQIAVATGGGAPDVERFCALPVRATTADTTLSVPQPALLLRSVRTTPGWFWRADQAVLTGPLSSGDLWQGVYRVRPGWQAHVMADSVLVQSPRWWWLRETVEFALPFVLGRISAGKLP